jgi:hypothetical protein
MKRPVGALKGALIAYMLGVLAVALVFSFWVPLMDDHEPWWGGIPGGFFYGLYALPIGAFFSLVFVPVVSLLNRKLGFAAALTAALAVAGITTLLAGRLWMMLYAVAGPYSVVCVLVFLIYPLLSRLMPNKVLQRPVLVLLLGLR